MENNITDIIRSLIVKAHEDGIQKYVVGAVIFNHEQEILFLKRNADEFMPNLVELPSGGVNTEESLIDALIRETKEETNLDIVAVVCFVDTFDYISGSDKKTRQFNFIVNVNNENEIMVNPEEHQEFYWLKGNIINLVEKGVSKNTADIVSKAVKIKLGQCQNIFI